jgi:hypothetical protein
MLHALPIPSSFTWWLWLYLAKSSSSEAPHCALSSNLLLFVNVAVFWDIAPWRWRLYVPPKRPLTYGLHGAVSQIITFIATAERTSFGPNVLLKRCSCLNVEFRVSHAQIAAASGLSGCHSRARAGVPTNRSSWCLFLEVCARFRPLWHCPFQSTDSICTSPMRLRSALLCTIIAADVDCIRAPWSGGWQQCCWRYIRPLRVRTGEIRKKLKRCRATKHLRSKNTNIQGVWSDTPCPEWRIELLLSLPVDDMKAQDGAATARLPSAGELVSTAYWGQPRAAVFHGGS